MKADIEEGSINGFAETLDMKLGELEILIYPREQIRINDPWNIKRSQVELAYIAHDMETNVSSLLLALHYDFSVQDKTGDPDEVHPIFHAQLTHSPIQLDPTLKAKNVDVSRMKGIPAVRLPTAHMSLPSVLLGVAADRFRPEEFKKLLHWMRGCGAYPAMVNPLFESRMTSQRNRMRSCAWYADLPALAAV